MTAQLPERLIYEGEEVALCEEPLADHLRCMNPEPDFGVTCTALWRGYVGTWEIRDECLYLVGLEGRLKGDGRDPMSILFPDREPPILADWYSGTLRIPRGRLLDYVHGGFESTYERDLLIEVTRGNVVSTEVRENGVALDPDSPEGYDVAAFTRFVPGDERQD